MKELQKKVLVFLAKFFTVFFVLYALLLAFGIHAVEEAIARIEAVWLGVQSTGNAVMVNENAFVISESCTGIVSAILLASLVFAFKKPSLGKKVLMIASGGILLFGLNLARVFAVLLTARELGVGAGEAVHVASWFAMTVVVVMVWYALTKRMVKAKEFKEMI